MFSLSEGTVTYQQTEHLAVSKDIKRLEKIILPEEYLDILKRHGTVYQCGVDWQAYDCKREAQKHVTPKRGFRISNVKRLKINSDRILVSEYYSGEFTQHVLLKRGKSWTTFIPSVLANVSTVKETKKLDVRILLDEMGMGDEVRQRYEEFFNVADTAAENDSGSD